MDVYIVGRNATAGENVLDALPQPSEEARKFIHCDATLMKEVVRATNEIKARTERVNYLVMS
jgi:NAD(P)-dependent dehydrogenase (short-subunit alcohol dehydrogenase family)